MTLRGFHKQKTFCCISLGWKSLPCRSQCYRFWVQNDTAHSLQLDTAPASFLSQTRSCLSFCNNQEVLCGHINDKSTVLQEKRHLKRLYVSALIISIFLHRGRSAFMPAPDIFRVGKLNLLPTSILLLYLIYKSLLFFHLFHIR